MARKKDERLVIPTSYICKKCGLARMLEDAPDKCPTCESTEFHKIPMRANWKTRQPFAVDNRQVSPL